MFSSVSHVDMGSITIHRHTRSAISSVAFGTMSVRRCTIAECLYTVHTTHVHEHDVRTIRPATRCERGNRRVKLHARKKQNALMTFAIYGPLNMAKEIIVNSEHDAKAHATAISKYIWNFASNNYYEHRAPWRERRDRKYLVLCSALWLQMTKILGSKSAGTARPLQRQTI